MHTLYMRTLYSRTVHSTHSCTVSYYNICPGTPHRGRGVGRRLAVMSWLGAEALNGRLTRGGVGGTQWLWRAQSEDGLALGR
jgi:hypothetical protein